MSGREKGELEMLKDEFSEFKAENSRALLSLTSDVKEIRDALLGTDYNPGSSYKARLERLEKFAEEQQGMELRRRVFITVLGGLGTAFSALVMFLINHWAAIMRLFGNHNA